ncbi:DNA alkylation repair protein [Bacillus spongiae]|uniref:DNA alkylation repair protein n=2 Tax=Bacillus spongiae TaxID=2683610 RepID=A0ABU8HFY3_9BACI
MSYTEALIGFFRQHRQVEQAKMMERYMRNQFPFLGIKTPERTLLLRRFFQEHGKPTFHQLNSIIEVLWNEPEREFQYVGLSLLEKNKKKLTVKQLPWIETLVTTKSWWDTVDHLASSITGEIGKRDMEGSQKILEEWVTSDNMWLNRTAILFQLKFKESTDAEILFKFIRLHKESNEFFLQKAIGWALREYSKTNPDLVINFIEAEPLASLSKREGLKYIKAKRNA